jgi:hypothetical protein
MTLQKIERPRGANSSGVRVMSDMEHPFFDASEHPRAIWILTGFVAEVRWGNVAGKINATRDASASHRSIVPAYW